MFTCGQWSEVSSCISELFTIQFSALSCSLYCLQLYWYPLPTRIAASVSIVWSTRNYYLPCNLNMGKWAYEHISEQWAKVPLFLSNNQEIWAVLLKANRKNDFLVLPETKKNKSGSSLPIFKRSNSINIVILVLFRYFQNLLTLFFRRKNSLTDIL